MCKSFLFLLCLNPVALTWSQQHKIKFMHPSVSVQSVVAFDSNVEGTTAVYTMEITKGKYHRISPKEYLSSHPSWSSDGKKLAYESNRNGNFDIYVYDMVSNHEMRLTRGKSIDAVPKWTPNNEVVFESNRDGDFKIYKKGLENQSEAVLLTDRVEKIIYPVWSKNGNKILFSTTYEDNLELCIADMEFKVIKRLTFDAGQDSFGSFSHSGEEVVFTSDRSGSNEIYKMNVDGTGLEQLTKNTENSAIPSFSPDDSKVVFMSRQNKMNSAIYTLHLKTRQLTKVTDVEKQK